MGKASQRVRVSRYSLVGSGIAFVVATGWLLLTAPGRVPSRFDESGEILEWTGLAQFVTLTSGWAAGVALVCGGARWYIPKIPDRALNVTGPHSDYWSRPENRDGFNTRFIGDLEWLGVLIVAVAVAVTILSGLTASGVRVPFWIMPTTTVSLLLVGLGYTGYVVYSGRYRPPA
ncbi:hypothetical protein LCL87_15920 [Rhodococcus hoagii]|nr:hypothetical protein [Prescottella equi]